MRKPDVTETEQRNWMKWFGQSKKKVPERMRGGQEMAFTLVINSKGLFWNPWFMEPEKREHYKICPDLDDFEETIHELPAGLLI